MKNLKSVITVFIIFSFLINTQAQEKITLKDAIAIALSQNTNVVQSQNSISTYKAGLKTAYGNFLPDLNLSGRWSWQRTSDGGGTTQVDYFGKEEEIGASQTDSRSYSLSAGGTITLFDGLSSFANLNKKENELGGAKLDFEKLKQDIIYQTASYFFTASGYDKLLEYQEGNYKYNYGLLEKMKEMKELNMISIADYYSQEVQTANSESSLLEAKINYQKAKISLLNYLSLDIAKDYTFEITENEIPVSEYGDESFEILSAVALNNRKDYQSKKLELENAESALTIANSGYLPSLSGSYGLSTSAVSPGDLFNRRVYNVGLSLNVPIFSGWSTEYSVQNAKVEIENTQEELRNLERNIKSEVMNVLLDIQTAKKQIEVTQKAIRAAEESWKINNESYQIGKVTYLELQQSLNDLLNAQNNNVQAAYNFHTINYEFMNTIGKISINN